MNFGKFWSSPPQKEKTNLKIQGPSFPIWPKKDGFEPVKGGNRPLLRRLPISRAAVLRPGVCAWNFPRPSPFPCGPITALGGVGLLAGKLGPGSSPCNRQIPLVPKGIWGENGKNAGHSLGENPKPSVFGPLDAWTLFQRGEPLLPLNFGISRKKSCLASGV